MESLSMILLSSPLFQNHPKTLKPISSHSISKQTKSPATKLTSPSPFLHSLNPLLSLQKSSLLQTVAKTHVSFTLFNLFASFPCLAASETVISPTVPGKVNLEAVLVSVDDFFNKNPFFVAGCTLIWLVVVPLIGQYLSKCKFVPAIDAFRKLRDDPNAQLLDIREKRTLASLGSPDLNFLNKGTVQLQYSAEDEDGFVKKVLEKFPNPANTSICVLDNFDGNSLKAAELLYQKGFKEAYAIRDGVMGKKGWMAIQETLLPPSVHIKRKKKKNKVQTSQGFGAVNQVEDKKDGSSPTNAPVMESQTMDHEVTESIPLAKYPDLTPPSSPTPSQPRE
ncbi:protein FRIGIDA-like [Hibiscus syriacus]|uniref:Protein FRIGIDA-like n=1 Tax=Hibiscus syriacus TaxID=106335 RepID=A0A6A2WYM9_HIBSY|nr:rhodanese-like domain-containing protein 4A, chloroplastic isoform X2 [Hibiscus syriacus]KAE8660770.1 protein FRIGIDA-like [Hibiscus syriacus]